MNDNPYWDRAYKSQKYMQAVEHFRVQQEILQRDFANLSAKERKR